MQWRKMESQISNRGRCIISNINQHLTICQQMLKIVCVHFLQYCEKIGAFIVYSLSFNLADFDWPKEQSTSIRYLCMECTNKHWHLWSAPFIFLKMVKKIKSNEKYWVRFSFFLKMVKQITSNANCRMHFLF